MNDFLELKNSLISELQKIFSDTNVTVLCKYNNNLINNLNKVVSVGFADINIFKNNSDISPYNLITINCSIDIYVKSIINNADCCYNILSLLYKFLSFNSTFDLKNISCKQLVYDDLTQFYLLPIIAQFDILVDKEV